MEANDSFRNEDFYHIKTFKILWEQMLKGEVDAALQELESEGRIKQDADGRWVPTDKPCEDQLPLFDKGEASERSTTTA